MSHLAKGIHLNPKETDMSRVIDIIHQKGNYRSTLSESSRNDVERSVTAHGTAAQETEYGAS